MTDLRCQQGEVYVAENQVPLGQAFTDLTEVERYVDALLNAPWWPDRFPGLTCVQVQPHEGSSGIAAWDGDGCGRIGLRWDGLWERVVLHELAHLLAAMEVGSHSHDPHWVRVYLELTFRALGAEAWTTLRNAFIHYGVELD